MTWFTLFFPTLATVLLAALLYAMPAVTPPTLPLGVSVPQSHTQEPAIRDAVRRFRAAVIVVLLVCVALSVTLTFVVEPASVIRVLAPVLLFIVLGIGSYVVARSGIARAKREGNWYEGVPVRLVADVTGGSTASRIPFGWYIAAVALLAVAAGIGVVVYPGLPNPLPVHWNADGVANRYADKSAWTVFGIVLSGLGLVALMFALSFVARQAPTRRVASDSPEAAAHRSREQRRLMTGLLGQLALVLAFEMSVLAVISWLSPSVAWLVLAHVVLLIALMAVVIAVYVVRYRHAMSAPIPVAVSSGGSSASASTPPATHPVADSARPDAPDDDRYWKAGLFYVNRNDPALLVPRRFGIGWTINLGHPTGIAIGVVLLLLIVGGITLGALAGPHHH